MPLKIRAEVKAGCHPTAHYTPGAYEDILLFVTPYARPSLEYREWMADLEKVRGLLHHMGLLRTDIFPPLLSFELNFRPTQ